MNVTKTERKESTKHCCDSGCRRRDSAEHEEEGGVDGMEVDELLQYLKDNGEEIRKSVLAGKYKPAPVRRVEIPKDNGMGKLLQTGEHGKLAQED